MKKRNTIGWNVVVALALLLAAGAAQAQTVVLEGTQAIGIDGLDVDGTIYDVDFSTKTNPNSVYGDFPGELDFIDLPSANVARDAVDSALDGSAATTVAASGETGETVYVVGYGTEVFGRSDNLPQTLCAYAPGPRLEKRKSQLVFGLRAWTCFPIRDSHSSSSGSRGPWSSALTFPIN